MNTCLRKGLSVLLSAVIAISVAGIPAMKSAASACGYTMSGTAHVQDYGDTEAVFDQTEGILTLGTRGQSKRVERITVNFTNESLTDASGNLLTGGLEYRVHVQDIGWMDWVSQGQSAGTAGQSKRLEGLEIVLTGDLAKYYSVQYQVHIQDYGDAQGFVRDGALAGTTGESKRLEEVKIKLVPIGSAGADMSVNYRVHRQDYGWEAAYLSDGATSGTTGQSKRLEGIEIYLQGSQYSGGIKYRTHVQDYGWQGWCSDGEMSGTQGEAKRLEAIQIELTGDLANYYDVYYCVHAQNYGWLDWAKNGEMSGTAGKGYRLEAIQIKLVSKGGKAPGATVLPYVDSEMIANAGAILSAAQEEYNKAGINWLNETSVAAGGQTVEYYIERAKSDGLVSASDLDCYMTLASTENIYKSIAFIEECNALRAGEGKAPLLINPALMTASTASAAISSKTVGHVMFKAGYINAGENLAWGYSDPFTGWYFKEKGTANDGHYKNIVNGSYTSTGFAYGAGSGMFLYGSVAEQSFSYYSNSYCMTTADYKAALDAYMADAAAAYNAAQAAYDKLNK